MKVNGLIDSKKSLLHNCDPSVVHDSKLKAIISKDNIDYYQANIELNEFVEVKKLLDKNESDRKKALELIKNKIDLTIRFSLY